MVSIAKNPWVNRFCLLASVAITLKKGRISTGLVSYSSKNGIDVRGVKSELKAIRLLKLDVVSVNGFACSLLYSWAMLSA